MENWHFEEKSGKIDLIPLKAGRNIWGHYRVATVREKSGKNKNFSRSGKSQGKSQFLSKSGNFAMRSKSREKRTEIENEEKNIDGLQKKLKLI